MYALVWTLIQTLMYAQQVKWAQGHCWGPPCTNQPPTPVPPHGVSSFLSRSRIGFVDVCIFVFDALGTHIFDTQKWTHMWSFPITYTMVVGAHESWVCVWAHCPRAVPRPQLTLQLQAPSTVITATAITSVLAYKAQHHVDYSMGGW